MTGSCVVCGDIGGTNSRLALFEISSGSLMPDGNVSPLISTPSPAHPPRGQVDISRDALVFQANYKNSNFERFSDVVAKFFADAAVDSTSVLSACLAVAGPVANDTVSFTNVGFLLSGRELESRFGIATVRLVNDFVAAGYGLLTLGPEETRTLQEGEVDARSPLGKPRT